MRAESEMVKSPRPKSSEKSKGKILKCFVMMPFGSNNEYKRANIESDYVYHNIIRKCIDRLEKETEITVETIRQVDKNIAGSITRSILNNIASSDICIVDITGRNPNVFFELGIRYCLRNKTTILMRQENTIIPFDIQGYRCMTYDCFKPESGIDDL